MYKFSVIDHATKTQTNANVVFFTHQFNWNHRQVNFSCVIIVAIWIWFCMGLSWLIGRFDIGSFMHFRQRLMFGWRNQDMGWRFYIFLLRSYFDGRQKFCSFLEIIVIGILKVFVGNWSVKILHFEKLMRFKGHF